LAASGRDWQTHDMRARLAINLAAERAQKFDDAARTMGLVFYHPDMKGLDWEALSARYRELALDTRLASEFNEVFNRLLGELNASHLGMWGGQPAPETASESVGRLGVELAPEQPERGVLVARA